MEEAEPGAPDGVEHPAQFTPPMPESFWLAVRLGASRRGGMARIGRDRPEPAAAPARAGAAFLSNYGWYVVFGLAVLYALLRQLRPQVDALRHRLDERRHR